MKAMQILLLSLSITAISLATDIPTVQVQGKPTCSVRDGVNFHRQMNYGKAFECRDLHVRKGSSAAQFNTARMNILGEGVSRSSVEDYKWLTIADRSGRP